MNDVTVINDEQAQRYEIRQGETLLGFAQYQPVGNAVMFTHTEVGEAHEGQGYGGVLAHAALDDVRAQGKLAIPMCPFIAAYIARHPQYVDLVHPQQRGVFGL